MKKTTLMSALASCILFFPPGIGSVSAAPSYEGYTLYGSGTYTYLVDMSGNQVHTWKSSGSVVGNSYLFSDGSVLVPMNNNCQVRRDGALPTGRFQRISWDGEIMWDFSFCHQSYTPGYDVEILPNGNILIPADNSSSAGAIFEIRPNGSNGGDIVWQYVLPDSLNSQGSSGGFGSGTYINSISYNPALDMILVDLQTPVNKLVVIDHSGNGRVVFTHTVSSSGGSTGGWGGGSRLHAAMWVSKYHLGTDIPMPDADTNAMRVNNLLVVNNTTRAVEVNMNTGSVVKTLSYSFANNEGSVQRLPNGNTLVQKGMNQTAIAELDDNGGTISTLTARGRCARAYRYGYTHPGLSRLSTFTINPVSPARVQPECLFDVGRNLLKISLKDRSTGPFTYRIISLSGESLASSQSTGNSAVINTKGLNRGVYCVEVNAASQKYRNSFIKIY